MEESKKLPAADSGIKQTDRKPEMSRRQALAALGKLAIYTAPVLTTLTMKVDNAKAQIASPPPNPPPNPF